MNILKPKYLKPIEREFEGWIISCIEDYFEKINKNVRIFAISPADELSFPADEVVSFDYKIVGLQLKKASLSNLKKNQSHYDYTNIYWKLTDPKGQFKTIQNISEIYYCLPTFINRDFKKTALEHCVFWRPEKNMSESLYWYNNPDAKNSIEENSMRWGQFIERIYSCKIGSFSSTKQITREKIIEKILKEEVENLEGLYILIIEL